MRRVAAVFGLMLVVSGCTGSPGGPEPTESPAEDPPLNVLALGDSWPYGAHCNGCTPFPELYADGLAEELNAEVRLIDLVDNGGTSAMLLEDLKTNENYRRSASRADVVMISTGANDMEPFGVSWKAGTCGGPDNLDCFDGLAQQWQENFDAMLDEIDELRDGKLTAVRLVTNSNEFLSDPGLIDYFGPDFGLKGGAAITAMHHDALCDAAAQHDAVCVDLRPVLNGPDLDQPRDVNTQEAMQDVADALVASGLDELDR